MPLQDNPVLCLNRVNSGKMSNLLLTSPDAIIGISILHFVQTKKYHDYPNTISEYEHCE
jgi:hypothetical protein